MSDIERTHLHYCELSGRLEIQITANGEYVLYDDYLAELTEAEARERRYKKAIAWALGYTDFRRRKEGEGAYWWRAELRERSGLSHGELQALQDIPEEQS